MRILDRYIGRAVLTSTLLALLVLLALDMFFAVVEELGDVGQGDYGMPQAMQYLLLTLPRRGYELFPTAMLLGSLLGLGTLAGTSELTAVRAAGVSLVRIVWAAVKAALVLVALAALVGEWLAPAAEQLAQRNKVLAQTEHTLYTSRYGFWVREASRFVNAERVLPGPTLEKVRIYELDSQYRLRDAYAAKRALYVDGRWQLEKLRHSRMGANGVATQRHGTETWPSLVDPSVIDVVVIEPEKLSAVGLYRYVNYMRDNNLQADRYALALWSRLMTPISAVIMVVLAMPFVFGPLRTASVGQRIVAGVLVGLAFYVLNQTLAQSGLVLGLAPWLSAVVPPGLFLGAALVALRRVR